MAEYVYLIIGIAVLLVGGLVGLVTSTFRRRGRTSTPSAPGTTTVEPRVGDDAETPRDTPTRTLEDAELPEPGTTATLEKPESAQGRLVRLRARLARSQGSLGKGLLALLVVVYVAYPQRGQDVPGAPWLGDAMRRSVDRLPTLDRRP